jgi:hypothetical protein
MFTMRRSAITLSGAYGSDGLPHIIHLPTDRLADLYKDKWSESEYIWSKAVPVPAELAKEYWQGGGHNSAGNEAANMRKWALANLELLAPKK